MLSAAPTQVPHPAPPTSAPFRRGRGLRSSLLLLGMVLVAVPLLAAPAAALLSVPAASAPLPAGGLPSSASTSPASTAGPVYVHISPRFSASIWANPNPAQTGQTVNFMVNYTPTSGYGCAFFQPDWCDWSIDYGDGSAPGTLSCNGAQDYYNFTHVYATGGSYTVGGGSQSYIVEYNGYPCPATVVANTSLTPITEVLGLNAGPITPVNPNIDVGGQVTLTANPSGGVMPYTLQWFTGLNCLTSIGGATGTTYLAAPSSTTVYSYQVTDSESPPVTLCSPGDTVGVYPAPTVAPVPTPTQADAMTTITFASGIAGGAPPINFTWHFGDGTTGIGTAPTHVYTTPGTYIIWLWANDSSTGRASGSTRVTIFPALVATANARPTTIDAGQTVHFFENVSGGYPPSSWTWTFGDGAKTTTGNTSHIYATSGRYPAIFWANDTGNAHDHVWFNITVNAVPALTVSATYNNVDVGVSDAFRETVTGGTSPFTYAWRFGDGGTSTGSFAPSHTFSVAGTYTVRAWANDSVALVATNTMTVTVYTPLQASASAAQSAVDVGFADSFTATFSGGAPPVAVSWVWGDLSAGSGATASHAYGATGSYLVHVWVNDSGGGMWIGSIPLTVNSAPGVTASATRTIVDVNVPITFTAAASGGTPAFGYTWRFGDGGNSGAQTSTHAFSAVGSYAVWVWANDSVGGSASTSILVTIDPALSARVTPTNAWIDLGMSASLSAAVTGGTPGYTYAWSLGDGTSSTAGSVTHPYAAAGSYTVVLWVNDSGGGSTVQTARVVVNPALSISSFSASYLALDVGHTTTLTVSASGGNGSWSYSYAGLPTGCTSADQDPLACTPSATGTSVVTVTVSDGLSSVTSSALSLMVNSLPSVRTFTIAPGTVTVGRSVTVGATISGGTAPVNMTYRGLPAGCSGSSLTFSCRPSTAGSYTVEAVATDVTGANATRNATLVVNAAPTISSFTATPASLQVDGSTVLDVAAAGGTGALVYAYTGLPGGCASQDLASLPCIPNATGTFTVEVTASDSMGASDNATLVLTVTAAPSTGGSGSTLFSGTSLYLLVAIIVVVAATLAVLVLRRRRHGPQAVASPPPPTAWSPGPPTSPQTWSGAAPAPPASVAPWQEEPAPASPPPSSEPTSFPPPQGSWAPPPPETEAGAPPSGAPPAEPPPSA